MTGNLRDGLDLEPISVYSGQETVSALRVQTLSQALERLDICDDSLGTVAFLQYKPVLEALISATRDRNVHARFITDITQENLSSCQKLMEFVELRHLRGVKGNFAVTDSAYYAFTQIKESTIPSQIIYSELKAIVDQQQYLFDTLWNSAMPAKRRIREIQEGVVPIETKIIRGAKEMEVIGTALANRSVSSYLYFVTDSRLMESSENIISRIREVISKNPEFPLLIITDIQSGNSHFYKTLLNMGVRIRHIDRNKVTFVLSGTECLIEASVGGGEDQPQSGVPLREEATWTNNPDVIAQMNQVFQTMWISASPAEARIKQLEEGIEPQETRLIEDVSEVFKISRRLTRDISREVLIIAASDEVILQNSETFHGFSKRQEEAGLSVRILSPSIEPSLLKVLPKAQWRKVDPTSVNLMIYDRKWMFITQYAETSSRAGGKTSPSSSSSLSSSTQSSQLSPAATPSASSSSFSPSFSIYSTSRQLILGMVSIFETLWRENELLESEEKARRELAESFSKEEKSKRQAQLLQDILTHDIRNYNQVSKLSAELIREKFANDAEVQTLIESLLQAIDGSTSLVERGRRLGRILSEDTAELFPTDLVESLSTSLGLIKDANTGKTIKEKMVVPDNPKNSKILVQADDLLGEVFSNILSNAVKYTEGDVVPLEIRIEEDGDYWKIMLSDRGMGIPKEVLPRLFDRYLAGAKGSGLGMSIVHALVVHRYGGKLDITSSQEAGSSGTTVYVWLKKAPTTRENST